MGIAQEEPLSRVKRQKPNALKYSSKVRIKMFVLLLSALHTKCSVHMDEKKLYCEHKNQYFPICMQARLICRVAESILGLFHYFLKEIFNSE